MMDVQGAIDSTEAALTVFKVLQQLPNDEARARVMAIAATKLGHYAEAIEFLRAAAAARRAAEQAEQAEQRKTAENR